MVPDRRSELLSFCRSLPFVTEDIKWGNDLIFSVGGKMFAGFAKDGTEPTFGCKVPEEDFAALTSVNGIVPAAYAARFHWINIEKPDVLPDGAAIALLRGSYELVKGALPKKMQRALGTNGSGGEPTAKKKKPAKKAKAAAPTGSKKKKAAKKSSAKTKSKAASSRKVAAKTKRASSTARGRAKNAPAKQRGKSGKK